MPVIDAHSHIYPDKIACKASSAVGDFYGVDMNAKNASASSMLAACEGSPITHHLVHSVATTPGQVPIINDFIAEQCRAHDNFVGFATMHQDFEDVEGEINRAIDLGLKGVKIHPDTQKVNMDDPRLMHLYEVIEGRLPIVIHTGDYRYDFSHPRRLKRILHTFPNLVVDAAHFGGWSVFDYALEYLEDENCYVDTSSALEVSGPAPHRGAGACLRRRARDVRQRLPHVEPRERVQHAGRHAFHPGRVRSHHLAQRRALHRPGNLEGSQVPQGVVLDLSYISLNDRRRTLCPWGRRVLRLMGQECPHSAHRGGRQVRQIRMCGTYACSARYLPVRYP